MRRGVGGVSGGEWVQVCARAATVSKRQTSDDPRCLPSRALTLAAVRAGEGVLVWVGQATLAVALALVEFSATTVAAAEGEEGRARRARMKGVERWGGRRQGRGEAAANAHAPTRSHASTAIACTDGVRLTVQC